MGVGLVEVVEVGLVEVELVDVVEVGLVVELVLMDVVMCVCVCALSDLSN